MTGALEILDLVFLWIQQIGIIVGVGGEIVALFAYLISIQDNVITARERSFARAIRRVVNFGLVFILLSGMGITIIHYMLGQMDIILQPAYIFKWYLILVLVGIMALNRTQTISGGMFVGLAGATWLALGIIHVIAPVISWVWLGVAYVLWMAVFTGLWSGILYLLGGGDAFTSFDSTKATVAKPTPAVAQPVRPIVQPVFQPPLQAPPKIVAPVLASPPKFVPPPVVVKTPPVIPYTPPPTVAAPQRVPSVPPSPAFSLTVDEQEFPYQKPVVDQTMMLHPHLTETHERRVLPTPPSPTMPASLDLGLHTLSDSDVNEHLPAIRVMPRSPEDIETQHRGPVVKFG